MKLIKTLKERHRTGKLLYTETGLIFLYIKQFTIKSLMFSFKNI